MIMGNVNIFIGLLILALDFITAYNVAQIIGVYTNGKIKEAKGRRLIQNREKIVEKIKKGGWKNYFESMEKKAGKHGFSGENKAINYGMVILGLPLGAFVLTMIFNGASFAKSVKALLIAILFTQINILQRKRSLTVALQKHGYKIYKYLNNQITSGIKVTDAIKNIYEVIDDSLLKEIFIKMAARYELTGDIDISLEELANTYEGEEADSFCVAVRQGILTGDNSKLLAIQEDIMFKKYFNYIQAETDNLKSKYLAIAVVFVAIIVIMIIIPMFLEAFGALEDVFMF